MTTRAANTARRLAATIAAAVSSASAAITPLISDKTASPICVAGLSAD
jgi:hypothetical protein